MLVLLIGLVGCVPKADPMLPWVAEARLTGPEIRVLPVLGVYDELRVNYDEALGAQVPWGREAGRRDRTAQLGQIPEQVALALPGEVQVALGDAWEGRFAVGRYPIGGRERLALALRNGGDLDAALRDVSRGETVLVTWVERLDGDPLTAEALPGWLVTTNSGPVLVDLRDEPYRVRAHVGMALVASDGEVIVRYADEFESVLTGHEGPDAVGRDLARALAGEVAKIWPTDPRFGADPSGDEAVSLR